eukprot:3985752-Lingulodinium_polyedra.AAC.1
MDTPIAERRAAARWTYWQSAGTKPTVGTLVGGGTPASRTTRHSWRAPATPARAEPIPAPPAPFG